MRASRPRPPFRKHVARQNSLRVFGPSAVRLQLAFQELVSQELDAVLVAWRSSFGKRSGAARSASGAGVDAPIQQVPARLGLGARQGQGHSGVRPEREPVRFAAELVAEQPELGA